MPAPAEFRCSFLVALTLAALICGECEAAQNPLLGSWKWDNNKTLREFKFPTAGSEKLMNDAAKAKRFIDGTVTELRSNMTLTYTESSCVEVIYDSRRNVLSRKSFPYKIVETTDRYLTVDQPRNGGVGKLFLEGNGFYVEVKVGDYTYKDYFTKL
jgi:hypothetical protein